MAVSVMIIAKGSDGVEYSGVSSCGEDDHHALSRSWDWLEGPRPVRARSRLRSPLCAPAWAESVAASQYQIVIVQGRL